MTKSGSIEEEAAGLEQNSQDEEGQATGRQKKPGTEELNVASEAILGRQGGRGYAE